MERTMAWERLNDPEYCGALKMGEYRDLLLRAGYSEEVANRAACERGWARLDAGVMM